MTQKERYVIYNVKMYDIKRQKNIIYYYQSITILIENNIFY